MVKMGPLLLNVAEAEREDLLLEPGGAGDVSVARAVSAVKELAHTCERLVEAQV